MEEGPAGSKEVRIETEDSEQALDHFGLFQFDDCAWCESRTCSFLLGTGACVLTPPPAVKNSNTWSGTPFYSTYIISGSMTEYTRGFRLPLDTFGA